MNEYRPLFDKEWIAMSPALERCGVYSSKTVPDKDLAKSFSTMRKPWYDKQVQLIFENRELKKLRDWLLPMLMNGQATVE